MQLKHWAIIACASFVVVILIRSSPALESPKGSTIVAQRHSQRSDSQAVRFIPPHPVSELRTKLEDAIGSVEESIKYLKGCRPTSQVRLDGICSKTNINKNDSASTCNWILQSLDDRGKEKDKGGDEFYIAYFDDWEKDQIDPTAVALVHDRNDGTFELTFVTTPMRRHLSPHRRGIGALHIFFQYTCGIGNLSPNSKQMWYSAGTSDLHFIANSLPEPPIQIFQPPTQYNLSAFSSVFFVGDSLFSQLVRRTEMRGYFRKNTYMADTIQADLTMATVRPEFMQHLKSRHGMELNGVVPGGGNTRQSDNMAVLIGSFVWDILASTQADSIENHLAACRAYVDWARRNYPNVTFFWKSGTAMHVHRLPWNCTKMKFCNHRTRYMSSSRAEYLYKAQKYLMKRLNVPFLDLFEATYLSAHRSRLNDGRHYTDDLNDQLSKFLFRLDR